MSLVGSNDVLVTHTTIVESARLFSEIKSANLARRLIEFCNLAECVVLNEHVFSLPGELPNDVVGCDLIKNLKDTGVHHTLTSDEFAKNALLQARRILGNIGNDRVYGEAVDKRYLEANQEHVSGSYNDLVPEDRFRNHVSTIRLQFNSLAYDPEVVRFFGRPKRKPNTLAEYVNVFQSDLNWNVSPNTDYVIHQIRNVVYWSSAEHFGLSYSPDFFRVDWVRSWHSRWKSSLSKQVYAVVAKAFRTQADEVRRDDEDAIILLPPIPAIIAQRAKTKGDVLDVLFDLRREFEGKRRSLTALQDERQQARSIADRRSATDRIKSLFASVNKLSGPPQQVNLATAFGYTGKLLDVVKDPLSPKSYVSLAEKGADWVQTWWNARPVFRLFYLKRRLEALPDYWELSKIITGTQLSKSDVRTFERSYSGESASVGDD
jgi:hypothetical protein